MSNSLLYSNFIFSTGKDPKDVFHSVSPVGEFQEPPVMGGKFRWQIIKILSEVGSEGRKSELTDRDGRIVLESRESSRPDSNEGAEGSQDTGREKGTPNQQEQMEMVYGRGVYLGYDASLKDLRNHFIDLEQLEDKDGHFQFLRSDVPGDRMEMDTEDEVLLCQIEGNLVQRRTMYIESIDPCEYNHGNLMLIGHKYIFVS